MILRMIGRMVPLLLMPPFPVLIMSVKRVRNTALRIAKDLDTGPDLVVVELTALFHDMAGMSLIILLFDTNIGCLH